MEFASDGEDGGHNMDIVEVMGSPVENGVDNDKITQTNDGAMNPTTADNSCQTTVDANNHAVDTPSHAVDTPIHTTSEEVSQLRDKLESLNKALEKRVHHIFYTSRTHSQLDQVVQELKRSNFLMQRHGDLGVSSRPR